jgi:cytochrome c biogenesis protein CcmG, thiol:disulfide interchange protein DsbE
MKNARTDTLLRAGIGLLLVALTGAIYAGIHERVVIAGDSAPGFTIKADNGRTISLPNFGGKVLVLNFWATWCPPCVQETPSLSRFAAEYAPKGVVVLGVSVDKDVKAYGTFLQKFKPAFLTARDTDLHAEYGTFMYPETYIIDTHGKVLKKIAEPADWMAPEVTQYINSLL